MCIWQACGASLAKSLDGNGSEAQGIRPCIGDRAQPKKAKTGTHNTKTDSVVLNWGQNNTGNRDWKARKFWAFIMKISMQLYSWGWKLFRGNKCLRETRLGHPHTTECWALGGKNLLDLLYSINSSIESAQGPSSNSEGKNRPQNVLELTVGRNVVSEGRLFYQDKEKIVTWACCVSQVIQQFRNEARLLEHSIQCSWLQVHCFFDVTGFILKTQ